MPPFLRFFGFWPWLSVILFRHIGILIISSAFSTVRTCLIQNPSIFCRGLRWLACYFCFLSISLLFYLWIVSTVLRLRTKALYFCSCRTMIQSWVWRSSKSIVCIGWSFRWESFWAMMYYSLNLWLNSSLLYTCSRVLFWVVIIIVSLPPISIRAAYWTPISIGSQGPLAFCYQTKVVCCSSSIFPTHPISI